MENDKNPTDRELGGGDADSMAELPATAPRARNRTVMLTPEITGQVRARLAQDLGHGQSTQAPVRASETHPQQGAHHSTGEFSSPSSSGAFYAASGRARPVVPPEAPAAPQVDARGPRPSTPTPSVEQHDGLVWQKKTPVVGFLVSYDTNPTGDVYELRSGRLIVTAESAGQGNYLLIKDESISPMHAILRISQNGEVQVLDQLSEFGTRIRRFGSDEERELSGDKGTVEHGDLLSFGTRKFHVCIIASPPEG